MTRNTRKRRMPLATKVTAGAAALALGGGGLVWANFYASAHEENGGHNRTKSRGAQVATINCPDVGQKLTKEPPVRDRKVIDGAQPKPPRRSEAVESSVLIGVDG